MNDAYNDGLNAVATPVEPCTHSFSSFQQDLDILHSAIQHLDHAVVMITQDGQTLTNPHFQSLLSRKTIDHFDSAEFLSFIHPEDRDELEPLFKLSHSEQRIQKTCRIQQIDSSYQHFKLSFQHFDSHPQQVEWLIQVQPIYIEQEKEQQIVQRQQQMLDASLDCIKLLNLDGQILEINRTGCITLGISHYERHFGLSWLSLLPPEVYPVAEKALKRAASGVPSEFNSTSNSHTQPSRHWHHLLTPMFNHKSSIESVLCVSRDITKQRETEIRLQHITEIDELTGLFNRHAFNQNFKEILKNAQKKQQKVGLLLIDLDYFKHVNDTFGHIAGDHLLHTLGERFKHCFKQKVVVARLGGDEFAILVPDLEDEDEIFQVAHLAHQQLEYSISYAGQPINGGMSIGCSIYPRDAQNTSNLLKCADIALNDLKNSGRGGIRAFNKAMFNALEDTTRQLSLARSILKSNRIVPYYQPKVCLSSNAVIGFEALLRWRDEQDQIQVPAHIMAAFQDYDLATRISETMQTKIFQDLNDWSSKGLEILPVSINAAPVEFLRDDYAEQLLSRLAQFNIPHHKIEVEITEQSLAEGGSDYVISALNMLKTAGVNISLDDFGTGHSSLTRLRDYPVDCIKIDRNFVEHLHSDPSALAIIKAITQIGSSICLDILVEGIENMQQLDTLKACDCRIGQGFFFYRPMNFERITDLLQTQ